MLSLYLTSALPPKKSLKNVSLGISSLRVQSQTDYTRPYITSSAPLQGSWGSFVIDSFPFPLISVGLNYLRDPNKDRQLLFTSPLPNYATSCRIAAGLTSLRDPVTDRQTTSCIILGAPQQGTSNSVLSFRLHQYNLYEFIMNPFPFLCILIGPISQGFRHNLESSDSTFINP